jgi:hypothetical protein
MIFLHYATSHPLYTYAFFSPRSKRVLYRQDAIFLVTTFPMRTARLNSGFPADGESLVAFRSPLASAVAHHDDLSFQKWQVGDDLPAYEDHVTGVSLGDDPNFIREESPDFPLDWPRRYPHHPSFGPPSTVPVPVPNSFPPTSGVSPAIPGPPSDFPVSVVPNGASPPFNVVAGNVDGPGDAVDTAEMGDFSVDTLTPDGATSPPPPTQSRIG